MRIDILGPAHPFRGGLAEFNEILAKKIEQQSIESTIYNFTTQYPDILFPGTSQFTNSKAPEKIKIERILSSINPFTWWSSGKTIAQQQPDILIIRYWHPFMAMSLGVTARVLKRKSPTTKIIALVDNMIPHENKLGFNFLSKFFVASCDAFACMSKSVKDDVLKFTNKPILELHHPIYDNFGEKLNQNTAKSDLGIPLDTQIFLFFGFIRAYKGLDLALKAMANPKIKEQKIKLLVAGEFYEPDAPYLQIIQQNNLDNIILNTEFIPHEDVKKYFSVADVVLQPYKTATQSGISQIAYHFEIPMIVTNVGGLSETVPHGKVGLVAEPNENAIAEAILKMSCNNYFATFNEGIKEEKKKYSWEVFIEKIISFSKKM